MELNTIFFIGPQGSGKGTQAKMLARKLGFFYWEMGAILREVSKEPTELGERIKNLIDNGVLLSDELLFEVVKTRLGAIPPDSGVIFDGIPRRMGQAEFLLDYLEQEGRSNFTTIYISLSQEECIKRLLFRGKLENRPDDTLESIELRLQQYYNATTPVIEYLRKKTNLIEIDGSPSIDEVAVSINSALGI